MDRAGDDGGKVVGLHGEPIDDREPNETAVRALREALEAAEAGEIVGVAMVFHHRDNLTSYRLGGRLGGHGDIGAAQLLVDHLVETARELGE